ncbi:MAG: hypothetical protein LC791_11055 [Acidobacteria bacterium]|nr:hypothetical protein [Acidobacteriota bacterium]
MKRSKFTHEQILTIVRDGLDRLDVKALLTWEFVQHEVIHHGQWSIYASLAGFDTPLSWRAS